MSTAGFEERNPLSRKGEIQAEGVNLLIDKFSSRPSYLLSEFDPLPWSIMSDLLNTTRATAHHNNPDSTTHHRDKAQAEVRRKKAYREGPAIAEECGAVLLSRIGGLNPSGSNGYCFRFGSQAQNDAFALGQAKQTPRARRVEDAEEYTREIIKLARERVEYWYTTTPTKTGIPIEKRAHFKSAGRSMVVTTPPWFQPILKSLPTPERNELMLELADTVGKKCHEVYGYYPWSGAFHDDTEVCHWHFEIPVVPPSNPDKPDEKVYAIPKGRRLLASKWTVGAGRVEKAFPGLLTPVEKERLDANLKKQNDGRKRLDWEIAFAVDDALEQWIARDPSLVRRLEQDKEKYRLEKLRAQREARYKRLFEEAIDLWSVERIWHLTYTTMSRQMKRAMWRAVPKEIRLPIRAFILTYQIAADPLKGIAKILGQKVKHMVKDGFLPDQPEKNIKKPK